MNNNQNQRSATVAGLLGIFLGAFGAHNWYLGEKKKGIIHVGMTGVAIVLLIIADAILPSMLSFRTVFQVAWLLSIINWASWLLISASSLWGLIEGIQILTKGDAGLAQPVTSTPNYGMTASSASVQPNQNAFDSNNVASTAPNSVPQASSLAPATTTPSVAQVSTAPACPPKQPMDPAKRKKIIIGAGIGVAVIIVAVVAVIVIPMLFRIDYGDAYRTAKSLNPEVAEFYRNTSCQRILDHAENTYVKVADYNSYAEECASAGSEISDLMKKLGETAGVKRNQEIKAQFDRFREGVESTLPNQDELAEKLAIYEAWHEFIFLKADLENSSPDSAVQAAAAPLISSENAALKSYGEDWLKSALKLTKTYRDYDNLSYGDPNKSLARIAYQNAQTDHNNWTAENKPNIKQLGGLSVDNNSKVYNEWKKLYEMISETYAQNYNSGGGDCLEFLGEVYCD